MAGSGPLVVRWRALEHAPVEAGSLQRATVEAENGGSAQWRTRGPGDGLFVAYHWLDDRGNAIVWDGLRTPLERDVEPGGTLRQTFALRGPIPPAGMSSYLPDLTLAIGAGVLKPLARERTPQ